MDRFGPSKTLLTGIALALFSAVAHADSVAYFTGNVDHGEKQIMNGDHPERGTVNLTGRGRQVLQDWSLGLDFRVDAWGIKITQLGVWDDNVMDPQTGEFEQTLDSPHTLQVYDLATEALITSIDIEPDTGHLHADYRYFRLEHPLIFLQGAEFSVVVGYYPDNVDSNGNSGRVDQDLEPTPTVYDSDGAIVGIGGARFAFGITFPDILDTGPPHRYHSGSFRYVVLEPMPEPGTLSLALLACGGVIIARRRRRET